MGADFPLSLTIKAVDKATGPLKAINAKIAAATAPMRKLGGSLGGLGAEFSGLSKGLGFTKVAESLHGVGKAVKNVGSEAFDLGTKLTAMAGVAGFALFSVVKSAVDAGDKLSEMAQRVGLNVDAYASLSFAAAQADIEQDAFNSSIDTFNKNLGEAKAGGGRMLKFLEKVSPVLAGQVKHAKTTEEAISLMTSAFEKVVDPAKRAALSFKAFGDKQFGQFLGQGSAEIQKQQIAYLSLAGSQEKFAKDASDLDNKMRETEMAFLGVRNAVAGALFPAISKIAGAVSKFLAANREGMRAWAEKTGAAIQAWVDGGGIDRLIEGFKSFASTVITVIDKLGGLQGIAIIVGAYFASGLLSSVLGLGLAVVQLSLALGVTAATLGVIALTAGAFVLAFAGVAAAVYEVYSNWEDLKFIFNDFWLSATSAAEKAWSKIEPIVEGLRFILDSKVSDVLSTAKDFYFGPSGENSRPSVDVSGSRPAPRGTQSQSSVAIDIGNLPKGSRVSQSPGATPVDLNYGYSMALP